MQTVRNREETEMFRTFNMGIGMIIIVSNDEANRVRELINVSELGKIEEGKGGVKLI